MLNFNNFEYSKVQLPKDENEKKAFRENLKNKFINEIKESEVCRNYLSQYNPDSIEKFIIEYSDRKVGLIESFDYYMRIYNQDDNEEYLQNARELLNYILQKKLFNLQLQWRAGQIVIEEIKTSYDFYFWERNIEYCPFIPPITENEQELMKEFLQTHYFSSFEDCEYWQLYGPLMEKGEDGLYQNIPDWYEFYDTMFGTGKLMLLPDLRGEREDFYIQVAYEANHKEYEEKNKNNPVKPYLPNIFAWYRDILDFVSHCENDPYFKKLFKLWHQDVYPEYEDKEYDPELVERAIKVLESANRPIILQKGEVWYQAIINSAEKYVTDRTLEVFDSVYEEYVTLANLGITKRYTPEEESVARDKSYLNGHLEMILKGRELCGEPRNFNF